MSSTPPSLLQQLRDAPADADAWSRFDAIYRPLLSSWLCRYSLQPHDADDVVQEILRVAASEIQHFHYDPARALPQLAAADHGESAARVLAGAETRPGFRRTAARPIAGPEQRPEPALGPRHDQHVLEAMLAQLEPDFAATTWQAFRQLAEGQPPTAVAAGLGLSVNAVLLARSRILKRLREAPQDMTD